MDVVVGVPNSDPTAGIVVAFGRKSGARDDVAGDLFPLMVAEYSVI